MSPELKNHSGSGSQEGTTLSVASPPAVHGPTVTAPTIAEKRICAISGSNRVLAKATRDSHTGYITCHGYCAQSSRCQECVSWDSAVVEGASEYQLELSRRARYAKGKGSCDASPVGTPSVDSKKESSKGLGRSNEQADSLSTVSSFTPFDPASQSGSGLPNQLASLLTSSLSVQDMFPKMIASQLHACLFNLNLLPACLLPQTESLVNDRPSLPKTAVTSRVQQALPAEGSREASLGIEPTSVRLARATQSAARSNTPLRHEVERNPLSDSSGLPSSRDSDVTLSEVVGPLSHLRSTGEGPTVCGLPRDEVRLLPLGQREKGYGRANTHAPLPRPPSA